MENNIQTDFIRQRIRLYIKAKKINELYFCKVAGLHISYLSTLKGSIRHNSLVKIIKAFPDFNPRWIATGKGKMLLEEDDKPFFTPPPRKFLLLQKLKTDIEKLKNEKKQLVPEVKNAKEHYQNMKHQYEITHKIVHKNQNTKHNTQHTKP